MLSAILFSESPLKGHIEHNFFDGIIYLTTISLAQDVFIVSVNMLKTDVLSQIFF